MPTTLNQAEPSPGATHARNAAVAGGILGAVAASSCCMLPLVLFVLGAGGPWLGNLTWLAPYQPCFLALAVACLGFGWWLVYRPQLLCAAAEDCRPAGRFVKGALVLATVLAAAAATFNFVAPLLIT